MTTARTLSCGHRKQTGYKVGRETDEPNTVCFFVSNSLILQSLYPREEMDQWPLYRKLKQSGSKFQKLSVWTHFILNCYTSVISEGTLSKKKRSPFFLFTSRLNSQGVHKFLHGNSNLQQKSILEVVHPRCAWSIIRIGNLQSEHNWCMLFLFICQEWLRILRVTVSSFLYYIIYLWPDDGLIGAETCSHSDK
jgi:hypothetical protein